MPIPDDSILNKNLIAFLNGDRRAGGALFLQARKFISTAARAQAPDLRHDQDDILDEVFVLMMEAPTRFDAERGPARAFILGVLVPEAIRRVRAKSARPGSLTRRKSAKYVAQPTFPLPDPIPDPAMVQSGGYGSPCAMEAACDVNMILSHATPSMRLIIGGLLDGKKQGEIATEIGMNRFQVARMVAGLQRQFLAVA